MAGAFVNGQAVVKGQKVRRIGAGNLGLKRGEVYTVSGVTDAAILLEGYEYKYDPTQFELVPEEPTVPHGGKDDKGKPNPGLLFHGCAGALAQVCKVLDEGAKKYAADSWKTVPDGIRRYRAAFERHKQEMDLHGLDAINPDFGLKHIDHAITDLLFIRQLMLDEEAKNAA